MPKKTKTILIVTFILVIGILIGLYLYFKNKNAVGVDPNTDTSQQFNPFGTSTKTPTTTTGGDGEELPTTEEVYEKTSRFHQITDFAVAGATFLEDKRMLPTGDVETVEPTFEIIPSLRYVERSTGHIYQMYLDTKNSGTISNSTIPGVYEVLFDGLANSTIYRYVSDDNKSITSFLAQLGGNSSFLAPDILSISLSPEKNKFFSLTKNKDSAVGTIKSFNGGKTVQIFSSPFSEWLPQWVTENNIYLTTKPSYLVEGNIFSLNITNGTLTKLFGGVLGLTTLSDSTGNFVLYGESLDIGPKLNLFDIKKHTSIDLGVYGLPEKCVWSNDNIYIYCAIPNTIIGTQYPDFWYQGLTSFTDYFVKININTKDVSVLANSQDETPIDAINLFLSKNKDKLFFINKKDGTLWSLDL